MNALHRQKLNEAQAGVNWVREDAGYLHTDEAAMACQALSQAAMLIAGARALLEVSDV